jgi:hypothetical protein
VSTQPARITRLKQVKQSEKADIFGKITPVQERFIEEYLENHFINVAANEAGVSERTARRWLALPSIQAAIERIRQERREMREDRLATCMNMAINILFDNLVCMEDPKEANRTHNYFDRDQEFKYVALMLKYAHDQREMDALKLRIAQLEAELNVVDGTIEQG